MHNHLQKGDGGDADVLEVMRIGLPWLCIADSLLFGGIVCVKSIFLRVDELDVIVKLYISKWSA